ncbi:hypothetical protein N0B44_06540 [Roseibacterium beibuensis]|uniref:hypothetical protein n=1 Tax=[Roseibacterium] beibuensis TaxID=1193142 RepID=UPI00217DA38A|nr:hypothetical protein [Roseibacterium beibuensis]MCS6622560.1 hypothetical protein [Roseibacterium beibuensis]
MTRLAALTAALFLTGAGAACAQAEGSATTPIACPDSVGADVTCLSGQDANGAWYVIAMPADWNRRLIVHAHGGPRMSEPEAGDSLEDLDRFSVMVRQGYAWIGSTYRRGGYGVRMAAEDTDNSRKIFWSRFGRPERTILHGQSWGGNVAAKASELYALDVDGARNYDGVLLTNGVVSGGTRAYQFRAGLRAVYQFYCRNHPAPDEPSYPLWQGLPAGADMTRAELRRRVEACTGVDRGARDRTPAEARRLRDILAVTGVREEQLVSHLSWATFTFQDLVHLRLGGGNPFDNSAVVYRGSSDDEALNAGVERFSADPGAVARLAYDSDLSGLIVLPTLTLHALYDPTVSYRSEAVYAAIVGAAGRSHLLVQAATDEDQHSKLADGGYLTALAALEQWISDGRRPDPAGFQAVCRRIAPRDECRFTDPVGS